MDNHYRKQRPNVSSATGSRPRASTDALMEQFYRSSDSLTDTELALCIAAENGGEFPDVKRDILELARRVIAEADGRVGV